MIFRRDLDKSWQMRTALLFLQQGYQALRGERREKAQKYRGQLPKPRMVTRDKEIQARAAREEAEFKFTPIDLAHFGSDPENVDELAIALGKKRLKFPRHIDTGSYSFVPIDLGNLGSDLEGDDEPPQIRRKKPSLPHSQVKGYDKLSMP